MGKRPKMLAAVIREKIAPALRECPAECGMVSLSDVVVSEDLSFVTAYVSALHKPELAVEWLESQRPALQRQMLGLEQRRLPQLRFKVDTQLEEANRIDELLNQAQKERSSD